MNIFNCSGDTDSVCSVTTTRYGLNKLGLSVKTPWYAWYTQGEVKNNQLHIIHFLVCFSLSLVTRMKNPMFSSCPSKTKFDPLFYTCSGWWLCSGIWKLDLCDSKGSWTFCSELSACPGANFVLILLGWKASTFQLELIKAVYDQSWNGIWPEIYLRNYSPFTDQLCMHMILSIFLNQDYQSLNLLAIFL